MTYTGDPPGTKWLRRSAPNIRRVDDAAHHIEDVFTPQENFERNKQWAKPGPYRTNLSQQDEALYQQWIKQQPHPHPEQYDDPQSGYDMRGYWQAMRRGDPRATTQFKSFDKTVHYPDIWKTPYDATFSGESMYALPGGPRWKGEKLYTPEGDLIYDGDTGEWHGVPYRKPLPPMS